MDKQTIAINTALSAEMKLLLAQYDLKCFVPSLQWLAARTIAKAISEDPTNRETIEANQENFFTQPLIPLARRIGF